MIDLQKIFFKSDGTETGVHFQIVIGNLNARRNFKAAHRPFAGFISFVQYSSFWFCSYSCFVYIMKCPRFFGRLEHSIPPKSTWSLSLLQLIISYINDSTSTKITSFLLGILVST